MFATRFFLLISALAFVLFPTLLSAQNVLPIRENGLFGLIDLKGKILVQPRFHEIGPFTEGVAPARMEGLYGYIDTAGVWQIPPRFDIADTFSFGVAVTRKSGELCLVNHFGYELVGLDYAEVSVIGNDRLHVIAEDGRTGIVDFSGSVILDLQPVILHTPLSGTGSLVLEWENSPEERRFSVVDYNGREIVPRGRYHNIDSYRDGFSMVSNYRGGECTDRYFIDPSGAAVYRTRNPEFMSGYNDYPSHGMLAVSNVEAHPIRDSLHTVGVIDRQGTLLFRSREYSHLSPISSKRLVAWDDSFGSSSAWLIDLQGNRIAGPYSQVLAVRQGYPVFEVRQSGEVFLCDLDGKVWTSAALTDRFPELVSSLSFQRFAAVMNNRGRISEELYSAETHGLSLLVRSSSSVPIYYFERDTVRGYQRGLSEIIWKSRIVPLKSPVNVSYAMPVSYRPPLSTATPDNSHLAHIRTKLLGSRASLSKEFYIEVVRTAGRGIGRVARLINGTEDTVLISSWGGGMTLLQQAKDSRGIWRDIETSPMPYCSQDYMIYSFSPGSFISLPLRRYSGPLDTRLRLKCEYARKEGETVVQETIYSNEYPGSVHPGQFWQEVPSEYIYPEPATMPIPPFFP